MSTAICSTTTKSPKFYKEAFDCMLGKNDFEVNDLKASLFREEDNRVLQATSRFLLTGYCLSEVNLGYLSVGLLLLRRAWKIKRETYILLLQWLIRRIFVGMNSSLMIYAGNCPLPLMPVPCRLGAMMCGRIHSPLFTGRRLPTMV